MASAEPRSDLTMIDPSEYMHKALGRFTRAMEGKQYGREALTTEWVWFRDGWDANVAMQRTAATDWWCDNG